MPVKLDGFFDMIGRWMIVFWFDTGVVVAAGAATTVGR